MYIHILASYVQLPRLNLSCGRWFNSNRLITIEQTQRIQREFQLETGQYCT